MFKTERRAVAIAAKAGAFASILMLYGCGGSAEDSDAADFAISGTPVPPESFSGALSLRVADSFATKDGTDLPLALYLGLEPKTETRLGINAFLDLREIQRALPDLLSGKVEADCGLDLDIDFKGAAAEEKSVRAKGTVEATLYRCRDRDTAEERRGLRLLSQTIDFEAVASASLLEDCISVQLADLELEPQGLLGGVADLFGVTKSARSAILAAAETKLAENPICPDLPKAIRQLDPDFSEAGLREIGEGGLGAALSGSFDLRAANIVELLSLAQANGISPGPSKTLPAPTTGSGVSYRIDESLATLDTEIAYGLDLRISETAPTRLGADAILDLQDIQRKLPDLLANAVLFDKCGARITLQGLEATASGTSLIATGPLELENYECERTDPGTWQRGALTNTERALVRFEASTEVEDTCVIFRLLGVEQDPPLPFVAVEGEDDRPEAIKALLLEAIGLMLEQRPLCPDLPPALELLDPQFTRGTPHEIGDGGVGIALEGSVDLRTTTLVEVLSLLQKRGVLPPSP
ncbi:hypothetical protein R3X27_13420 [Tropicimonas sp. TH_r6]|uniref:hypothetical protein n=1 Tax=Tropicimonas sp. TH_r6 TaxID=3082085 RepID=UPI002954098B|nr:hypothetical protein [Tropicimonas sp. TH_r6]MDV7143680.1 hypothetical protein [Tropicimonas sp. TH_r6]